MVENENGENPPLVPEVNINKPRSTRKFQNEEWQGKNSLVTKDTKEELQRSRGDQQKIDELTEQLQKQKKISARLQADYQNLERQKQNDISVGVSKKTNDLLKNFIDIYEDFIRAKDAFDKIQEEDVDNLNIIIKNMKSILENYDVKQIETKGKKSDPKLHEVLQVVVDNNHEEGTIVKEIAKGYIIRNEVLKYSKVCVSKKLIKK